MITQTTNDQAIPPSAFAHVVQPFTAISLEDLCSVALLRRVDTKYVLREHQLYQALANLSEDYAVLEIAGRRLHHYRTLYFDTPNFALYRQHHNGLRSRYKVRSRAYMDTHLNFLEVKHKTNKDITIKSRQQMPEMTMHMDTLAEGFIESYYPDAPQDLEPKVWNSFQRITLVSKHAMERLTLDIGVHFWWKQKRAALPGIAVAEVKQPSFSLQSDFVDQMRMLGVRAMRFSKYCMGVSLLYDQVKHNNFKPQWLYIDKLLHSQGGLQWAIS